MHLSPRKDAASLLVIAIMGRCAGIETSNAQRTRSPKLEDSLKPEPCDTRSGKRNDVRSAGRRFLLR